MNGAAPTPSPDVERNRPPIWPRALILPDGDRSGPVRSSPHGSLEGRDSGIELLTEADSVELLRTEEVGRLGVVVDGRPEIFPVNYRLDAAGAIVYQTAPGMKLAAALNHHAVFEVDNTADHKAVWSVIVHGIAHHTALESLQFEGPRPSSWLPDRSDTMRITVSSISGRRFVRSPPRTA